MEAENNLNVSIRQDLFEDAKDDAVRRLNYADQYAQSALKSLFLMNGGSIISILTLIGNSKVEYEKNGIFWALVWYSIALSCVIFAYLCAYFCQNYFMLSSTHRAWKARFEESELKYPHDGDHQMEVGNRWIFGAITSAVVSFALFLIGSFVALFAIT